MTTRRPPLLLRMIEERHHRDDDDRPLREIRTPPEHLRPGDIEQRACPYAGTRHGQPMNSAALRQMSTHWDAVIDALAMVRGLYVDARGPAPLDLLDVWRLSQYGAALPWFYLLRLERSIPGFAAVLAKANQGVGLWAQRVLVDAMAGAPPPAMTADAIVASAEANGTLLGEVEACAGSPAMMRRFFDALLTGAGGGETPAVAELTTRGADLAGFAAHYTNLKLVWWLLTLARRFVYADLAAAVPSDHPAAAALCALREDACDPPDFFLVGPADPAAVPRPARAAWLAGLARLVVPLAPADGDRALIACAAAVAVAAGEEPAVPSALLDDAREQVGGAAPAVASALATFARLDAILADAARAIETGLRGDGTTASFDAATRDRLLSTPGRTTVAALAPRWAAVVDDLRENPMPGSVGMPRR